jgi:hypothetical protein
MIKQLLCMALLPVSFASSAACVNDTPEIGDIGPASELVCKELDRRFPNAALAVETRSLQSPIQVTVLVSVDGAPLQMHYDLNGYSWKLDESRFLAAVAQIPEASLSMSP